jgi:hypothetical protein
MWWRKSDHVWFISVDISVYIIMLKELWPCEVRLPLNEGWNGFGGWASTIARMRLKVLFYTSPPTLLAIEFKVPRSVSVCSGHIVREVSAL